MSALRRRYQHQNSHPSCRFCRPEPVRFEYDNGSARALTLSGLYASAVIILGVLFGPGIVEVLLR